MRKRSPSNSEDNTKKVRYAVVGLGWIAQSAVLPAFANARKNSELTALVSDDPVKLKKLGAKYKVTQLYSYDQYEECLSSGLIDAVYIALPNSMHCKYTIAAAEAGIHVLCEKPMAVTVEECERMLNVARAHDVRLMIAYRLHFERSNLKAVQLVQSGRLGDLRIFDSVFTMQVKAGDVRVKESMGGGTLYDIGIYCINASRYLFCDEPTEVFAFSVSGDDPRFREVDEMTSAVLRFPGNRLATFTSSFGAASVASFRLVGTRAELRVEPCYEIAMDLKHYLTRNDKTKTTVYKKQDQFAPELIYFSDCVRTGKKPQPSAEEGLADVRIIRALYESSEANRPVMVKNEAPAERPSLKQELRRPVPAKRELVHTQRPFRDV